MQHHIVVIVALLSLGAMGCGSSSDNPADARPDTQPKDAPSPERPPADTTPQQDTAQQDITPGDTAPPPPDSTPTDAAPADTALDTTVDAAAPPPDTTTDAPAPDSTLDAGLPPVDLPKAWSPNQTSNPGPSASCIGLPIAGGGKCGPQGMTGSFPGTGIEWFTQCKAGSPATAYAVCAPPTFGPLITTASNKAIDTFVSAQCTSGAPIGGGCQCAGSAVLTASYPSGARWRCECSAQAMHTAYVYCFPPEFASHVTVESAAGQTNVTATCPAGFTAAGGGGRGTSPNALLVESFPPSKQAWTATGAPAGASVTVYVVCVN